jgi:hypothetical protein
VGVKHDNVIVSIHVFDEVPPLSSIVSAVTKYLDRAFAVKVAVKPFKGYKAFLASLLELSDNVAVIPMGVEEAERAAFALPRLKTCLWLRYTANSSWTASLQEACRGLEESLWLAGVPELWIGILLRRSGLWIERLQGYCSRGLSL